MVRPHARNHYVQSLIKDHETTEDSPVSTWQRKIRFSTNMVLLEVNLLNASYAGGLTLGSLC
jgi:hypothetical protein